MASERDPRFLRCALHDAQFPRGLRCPHCVEEVPGEPDIRCMHCDRRATRLVYLLAFDVPDVPPHVYPGFPVCDAHSDGRTGTETRSAPIVRSDLVAALICAGIHGSPFSPTMLSLLADPEGAPILLDEIEGAWLTRDGWFLPVADRDWPERDDHGAGDNPHVWFPCKRSERRISFERGITEIEVDDHRCTCGMYKSQYFEFHADWHEFDNAGVTINTVPTQGAPLTTELMRTAHLMMLNPGMTREQARARIAGDTMREANRRLMERQTGLSREALDEMLERYGWARVGLEQAENRSVTITVFHPCGHPERVYFTETALDGSMALADLIVWTLHDLGERGPTCGCGRITRRLVTFHSQS